MNKQTLRTRTRAERDRFVATDPAPIIPQDAFLQRLRPGIVVASYRPVGSEADPVLFDATVLAAGAELALPHVTSREGRIRFLAWHPDHGLAKGPFGLHQPHADSAVVTPDIILTPLVAFDLSCNRLGQGAGHYDRAFADFPDAWRLGIAWSVQQVEKLPVDPWDVPLHGIATERGVVRR
ncbi:5-formyltetrahydrofolate cyclo-ligase [Stakelama sediminis]|uniref:5-formyltetrahydrofolate cyclo-ligase n=1 Tax=Stakelama sediminis TaxID=463200 RepID=A0A840YYZ4_9SPHN|nr:5-formyltetrahydrofolate cyclo-ligase [Stakelama sediminis]MBB5718759.1 5-formyltetrahydrofolate cyclo-ligase [Stakelama sediminis]